MNCWMIILGQEYNKIANWPVTNMRSEEGDTSRKIEFPTELAQPLSSTFSIKLILDWSIQKVVQRCLSEVHNVFLRVQMKSSSSSLLS